MGGVGHGVDVRGGAQESSRDVIGAPQAHVLNDGIGGQRQLHVQVSVKVGVVTDRQRLALGDVGQEIQDLRGLLNQVASDVLNDLLVGFALLLRLGHGENDGARGLSGRLEQTGPHVGCALSHGAGDVDAHQGGAVLEELVEGSCTSHTQ